MTDTIANLPAQPEGKTLELKRDLSSTKPLLTTLAAFANSTVSTLIVGVDGTRSVIGVGKPFSEEDWRCSLIDQWGSGIPAYFPKYSLSRNRAGDFMVEKVWSMNPIPSLPHPTLRFFCPASNSTAFRSIDLQTRTGARWSPMTRKQRKQGT